MINHQYHNIISLIIVIIYWLLVAVISIRILMNRKSTSYVAAWLLIIYIVPIIGICAYFLFGERYIGRQRIVRARKVWNSFSSWFYDLKSCDYLFQQNVSYVAQPLFDLCKYRQGLEGIKGNQITLYTSTEEAFRRVIEDINNAVRSIDMVFYIWHPHGIAKDVAEAFILAARRGIKCRLLLDSAGSHGFFKSHYPQTMRRAGVEVVEALSFNPLRIPFRRLDLRQHRKMIIIDGQISYTGSMNIIDPKSFKINAGVGEWVDIMMRIHGPISTIMTTIFASDWEIETGKHQIPDKPHNIAPISRNGNTMQVIASGPGFFNDIILQALLTAIYSARRNLVLISPYFVPCDELANAICSTAQRGVNVTIILPEKNDSLMVGWASKAYFKELLDTGVAIYGYRGGLLHTKCVLVDEQLTLIGTVNLDMRSLWLNFEITTIIDSYDFYQEMSAIKDQYLASSVRIDPLEWHNRPFWHRIVERLFYFFSPLL